MAEKDYVWMKKYPNGEVLWQERRPDDSMDVWLLPMYTTEQLYEQYSTKEEAINIKVRGRFELTGRGIVFTIDLEENNIPRLRKEFNRALMGKEVIIEGKNYLVKGIEAFATGEGYIHTTIGLLIKEL